ncbi:uncharacterized protein LOC108144274 [Drosophila elegans]|uniref:uncharacterized protein LOC108144274 n=1 Tax=Drosophila elegans TaxID=30023 RepID=UPI0007E7E8AC|nr:uncharacterized protein LOC108144274 [Drosophila elegans]
MSLSQLFLLPVLLGVALNIGHVLGQTTIDCQRPPQLVDPALCCRDGGRDQVTEQCAQRILGAANGQKQGGPPSLDTAACLAECIMKSNKYIDEPQKLNLDNIRSDLSTKFSNDTAYVEAMTMAFSKCEPQSQRRLAMILQQQQQQQQPKCSPFSAIVLGCTYMEYFKNCPDHRWTQNAQCALAKAYVTQCGLGA